jgi:integrase
MTNRKKTETRNIRVSANVVVRQTKAGRFIARVSNGVTTTSVPIPEADTMQSAITLVESSGIIEVAKARQPQAVAERYRHIMSKSEGGMTNEFLIREYIRDREFRGITPRTTEVDEDALRRLIDISESHQLASVNEGDINAFANSPETKRTLSLSTRGGRLNRLNLFYQWMIKSGHYHSSNPCKNVRVVRAGTPQEKMIVKSGKPFTEEEVNELVRRAKEGEDYPWWLRFVVLIAAETGLRKGDCFNMDWASYDRSDNVLVIVTS